MEALEARLETFRMLHRQELVDPLAARVSALEARERARKMPNVEAVGPRSVPPASFEDPSLLHKAEAMVHKVLSSKYHEHVEPLSAELALLSNDVANLENVKIASIESMLRMLTQETLWKPQALERVVRLVEYQQDRVCKAEIHLNKELSGELSDISCRRQRKVSEYRAMVFEVVRVVRASLSNMELPMTPRVVRASLSNREPPR